MLQAQEIKDRQKLLDHVIALEHTRADLWGVNEYLSEKIKALERGQEDLLIQLENFKAVINLVATKGRAHFSVVNKARELLGIKLLPKFNAVKLPQKDDTQAEFPFTDAHPTPI